MIEFFFDFFLFGVPLLAAWKEKKLKAPVTRKKIKKILSWLGFNSMPAKKMLISTAFLLIAMLAVGIAVDSLLTALGANDIAIAHEKVAAIKAVPLFAFYILAVRVAAEEVFFRGLLVKKFGIFLASVAFGLAHAFYGSNAEIMGAFALGLLLSWSFLANKSIYPNILAHGLYNFVVLMVYV